jgi:hypothetical protein
LIENREGIGNFLDLDAKGGFYYFGGPFMTLLVTQANNGNEMDMEEAVLNSLQYNR